MVLNCITITEWGAHHLTISPSHHLLTTGWTIYFVSGRDNDSIKNGRSSNLPEADRAELDDHTTVVESLRQELSTLQDNLSLVTKEKEEVIPLNYCSW